MNRFRLISSVGYYLANTDDEIQAQWLTLTIGAEFTVLSLLSNTVDVNTRVEIVAERLRASVIEKITGQSDSGVRWQPGVKVGVDGTYWWLSWLGGGVGLQMGALESGTPVRVRGVVRGEIPAFSIDGTVGLRARW